MEQTGVVAANFGLSFSLFFLSIFVHISGSIRPITLIWASLERSFPPAEVEYRWCQFWSKVMKSEVEERPRFVTAGYGRHRSQWVNCCFQYFLQAVLRNNLIFYHTNWTNHPLSRDRSQNVTISWLISPSFRNSSKYAAKNVGVKSVGTKIDILTRRITVSI